MNDETETRKGERGAQWDGESWEGIMLYCYAELRQEKGLFVSHFRLLLQCNRQQSYEYSIFIRNTVELNSVRDSHSINQDKYLRLTK